MKNYSALLLVMGLSGCNLAEQLSTIGERPQLTEIQDPTRIRGYQPISMPMPTPVEVENKKSPSLWQSGAQGFFKDQRAGKVGDIITVNVVIDQQESIEMTPTMKRTVSSTSTVNNLMGLERKIPNLFPKSQRKGDGSNNPSWFSASNSPDLKGSAKYDVKDKLKFKIATTVTQILPNGNMVIDGRQELRVVNEVREILLRGIIRREDISATNIVNWDKISELRISYGGRGDLSDLQSFPWGHQVMNKISPF